ncbi:MAG: formylglycine-generating enzyme family protein [Leptolyngbya sp. SIO4C1]|nr:formylglycine-generating enzyme family protein [Leptolyngbya sp. SIO4C1]
MATVSKALTLHRYRCLNKAYTEALSEDVSLTLMLIPAGEFRMGTLKDEPNSHSSEQPQHRVTVPSFLMGRYPVTQVQWRIVAGYDRIGKDLDPAPSRFKGDVLPVEQVSWEDATEFCRRLAAKTGKAYSLPSEAQWEYACRAGTQTAYHFGDRLTAELANYRGTMNQTSEVGHYPANRWGLHDMHSNVWEWCEDHWHKTYAGAPEDGTAWISSDESENSRVLRGGSWNLNPEFCRSADRLRGAPGLGVSDSGFRVVCGLARD